MKAIYLIIIFLVGWQHCFCQNLEGEKNNVFLTILCDNRSVSDSIYEDHGFSCLIESGGDKCLFDAGGSAQKILMNMDKLNVTCSEMKYVFISHIHNDHLSGLQAILNKCNIPPVLCMPFSYPQLMNEPPSDRADKDWQAFLDQYKPLVSDLIQTKESYKIGNIGYSTGVIENIHYEQSLIVPGSKGLVIVTGCSHSGILEIVKHAKTVMKQDVYIVLGGFHLMEVKTDEIRNIAGELRKLTKLIGPCHCTGEEAMNIFQNVFKKDYVVIKAGTKFNINESF
jgi:7,8-dihydropterin-6-yl-methyl-4-(beta-D-ribofuranosyl)aminobenzene 5'-phosphate synthase